MKKNRSVLVYASVCAIILCTLLLSMVERNVKTAAMPALQLATTFKEKIENLPGYFIKIDHYKNENTALRHELKRLQSKQVDVRDYEAELNRLYKLLDMKGIYENNDFSAIGAKVVAYDFDNWCYAIKIDKGDEDGVLVGNLVVSSEGLVGIVTETGKGYSIISTILDFKTTVSVRMVRNGQPGLLKGNLNELCQVEILGDIDSINVGDVFVTTGDGGAGIEDICVGSVVKTVSNGAEIYAELKPSVEFSKLKEVLVLYGR